MTGNSFMPSAEAIAGIRSDFDRYEAERSQAARSIMWRTPVFVGLVAVAVVATAYFLNTFANPFEQWSSAPHVFLYIGGLIAAGVAYFAAQAPARQAQQAFREKLMPVIFGFVGNVHYARGVAPQSFPRLPRQTVGSFNRQRFNDIISGEYEGFSFELYEATFEQKVNKTTNEVFKGVVVQFDLIAPFPGVLVAGSKSNAIKRFFGGLFGGDLELMQSGVVDLDDSYDFRTDNPDAAAPLLAGRLAQALRWLDETWPERPSRVALSGPEGFLLIPLAKNHFELPPISQSVDYARHIEPMVADLAALLATAALVRKAGSTG